MMDLTEDIKDKLDTTYNSLIHENIRLNEKLNDLYHQNNTLKELKDLNSINDTNHNNSQKLNTVQITLVAHSIINTVLVFLVYLSGCSC